MNNPPFGLGTLNSPNSLLPLVRPGVRSLAICHVRADPRCRRFILPLALDLSPKSWPCCSQSVSQPVGRVMYHRASQTTVRPHVCDADDDVTPHGQQPILCPPAAADARKGWDLSNPVATHALQRGQRRPSNIPTLDPRRFFLSFSPSGAFNSAATAAAESARGMIIRDLIPIPHRDRPLPEPCIGEASGDAGEDHPSNCPPSSPIPRLLTHELPHPSPQNVGEARQDGGLEDGAYFAG